MSAKTTLIKAIKHKEGWILIDVQTQDTIDYPSKLYSSRNAAYKDCKLMWPNNGTWRGRKVHGGYRIYVGWKK